MGRRSVWNVLKKSIGRCMLPVCLIVTLLNDVNAQKPIANFTTDKFTSCYNATTPVNFTDQSSNAPTVWLWTFGDGSSSAVQNPQKIYQPGTYNVKLVVSNAFGADSITKAITVYPLPSVQFNITGNTTGCIPLSTSFTDVSTSGAASITSQVWDFGDGESGTGKNTTHDYTIPGLYSVVLKVTDSNGCIDSLVKSRAIRATGDVTADFSFFVPVYCQPPVAVSFYNNSSAGSPLTYSWDFGDGGTDNANINPTHNFSSAGTFSVKLTARDVNGCAATAQKDIPIVSKNTSFTTNAVNNNACIGMPVTFNGTSVPAPNAYWWDFGDTASGNSNQATIAAPSHTFNLPGSYLVKLVNSFPGGCRDSSTLTVNVGNLFPADFTSPDAAGCSAGHTVNFTAASSGAASYTWDFGDGSTTTSSQSSVAHTYNATGSFNVTLTAVSSTGCRNSVTKNTFVNITPPVISGITGNINTCINSIRTFSATITAADQVTSYNWNFGDGTTLTSPTVNATHAYSSLGSYTATLTITTSTGCTASQGFPVVVTDTFTRPSIRASIPPPPLCAGTSVSFTSTVPAAGGPYIYSWNYGDSSRHDNTADVTHQFNSSGLFNVVLTIINSSGCMQSSDTIPITIIPPTANFGVFPVDCRQQKNIFNFVDSSALPASGNVSYNWDFGNGNTFTQNYTLPGAPFNPPGQQSYASNGVYTASLTVSDPSTGCVSKTTKPVYVGKGAVSLSATTSRLCARGRLAVNVSHPLPSMVKTYTYQYSTDPSFNKIDYENTLTVPAMAFSLANPGIYYFRAMTVDVYGCVDTAWLPFTVLVSSVNVGFSVNKPDGCIPLTVNFTDTSRSVVGAGISSRIWYFGDSLSGADNSSTLSNPSHIFNDPGSYNIKLVVTDSLGCKDSIVRESYIVAGFAKADFMSPDSLTCPGRNVRFADSSLGNIQSWQWIFDNGVVFDGQSPMPITYSDTTAPHPVKLIVTSVNNCVDSIVKYITVKRPIAKFGVSDNFSVCPPLRVNFIDSSYFVKSWNWAFGDGGFSSAQNPSYLYTIPGNFTDTLIVTSPGGCTDTATHAIEILGPYGTVSVLPTNTEACDSLTVSFAAHTNGATGFTWDYGDGVIDSNIPDSSVVHTYNTGGYFLPIVLLKDKNGCVVPLKAGNDTIKINKIRSYFTADKFTLCDSGIVRFIDTGLVNVSGTVNFLWDFGDGTTSAEESPAHFYSSPGIYAVKLIVENSLGCSDSLSNSSYINIYTSPQPVITVTDSSVCLPATFTLTGGLLLPDSIVSWKWRLGSGDTSVLQNPPLQRYTIAGSYTNTLTATNNHGCSTTASRVVNAYALPAVKASGDMTICRGGAASLLVTGADTYTWSPVTSLSCDTCSNPSASPLTDIAYIVTGRDIHGCVNSDTVSVKVLQPYVLTVNKATDSICEGKRVQLFASGAPLYRWTPDTGLNNPFIASPATSPDSSITYQVEGYDSLSCFNQTLSVQVTVVPDPTVEIGQDVTLPISQSITLVPKVSSDVIKYTWAPYNPPYISCSDCPNPVITGFANTEYTLEVANAAGCIAQDKIKIVATCDNSVVFIPNTFSPNGDNVNDVFFVNARGVYTIKSIVIFNRWGEKVFENKNFAPNNPAYGWDGKYKGQMSPQGVYVYMVETECSNGQTFTYKGSVTLLR